MENKNRVLEKELEQIQLEKAKIYEQSEASTRKHIKRLGY
jgi:hypothetical protein